MKTTAICVGGECINARFLSLDFASLNREVMPAFVQLFGLCIALFGLSGCVRETEFYPFGTAAGDQELARDDDGNSMQLLLEKQFPYYDRDESILYVSSRLFPCSCLILQSSAFKVGLLVDNRSSSIIYGFAHARTVGRVDYWMRAHPQSLQDEPTVQTAHTAHRSHLQTAHTLYT